jgi:ABC-type Fe3+-hydroxamate transport system substrate-binding protein
MERLGLRVYTCDTPDIASILSTLISLGRLAGEESRALALAASYRERLESVARAVSGLKRPRTLFVLWGDPLMAPGGGTFLAEALERAGAESITASAAAKWAEVDIEAVMAARPEVILTASNNAEFVKNLIAREMWRNLPAVLGGRVHILQSPIQQPGPGIVDAIEEMARLLHPGMEAARPSQR